MICIFRVYFIFPNASDVNRKYNLSLQSGDFDNSFKVHDLRIKVVTSFWLQVLFRIFPFHRVFFMLQSFNLFYVSIQVHCFFEFVRNETANIYVFKSKHIPNFVEIESVEWGERVKVLWIEKNENATGCFTISSSFALRSHLLKSMDTFHVLFLLLYKNCSLIFNPSHTE